MTMAAGLALASAGQTPALAQTQAHQREYAFAIHGGAGNIAPVESDPAKAGMYYAALDSALAIGDSILANGGEALQAVEAVINYFELNPLFNSGKGATCTSSGTFELDASVMDGRDLNAGAVAGVKTVKHPISAAMAVMNRSEHVMLCGEGAESFAASQGLEMVDNMYFATPKTLRWVEEFKKSKHGTVGCVALDRHGNLAAGTSTGGMFRKSWGRIGDSPVIGAGTYADNASCAVSCTGHGEYFIRHAVAHDLCARYRYLGQSVEQAADEIVHHVLSPEAGSGGLIAVDHLGNIAMPFNSTGMYRGCVYKDAGAAAVRRVGIGPELIDYHKQ